MKVTIYHVEKGGFLSALIVVSHKEEQFSNAAVHFYDTNGHHMTTHHLSGEDELSNTIYIFGFSGFNVFEA